jgi:hypothetical protein
LNAQEAFSFLERMYSESVAPQYLAKFLSQNIQLGAINPQGT